MSGETYQKWEHICLFFFFFFTCAKYTEGLNHAWCLQRCFGLPFAFWWVCFYLFVDRLQPNVDTRQKQLAAWCSLALSYCRHHKLYTLDVMEAQESPVFNNKKIERILTVHLRFSQGQQFTIYYITWSKILSWIVYSKRPVLNPCRLSCLRRLFDLDC